MSKSGIRVTLRETRVQFNFNQQQVKSFDYSTVTVILCRTKPSRPGYNNSQDLVIQDQEQRIGLPPAIRPNLPTNMAWVYVNPSAVLGDLSRLITETLANDKSTFLHLFHPIP